MSEFSREQLRKMAQQGKRDYENRLIKEALDLANNLLDMAPSTARHGGTEETLYRFTDHRKWFSNLPKPSQEYDIARIVMSCAKQRGFDVELRYEDSQYICRPSEFTVVATWA